MHKNSPITPEEITQYLLSKGIKPSMQRIIVYRYLREHCVHPTVDIIYRDLIEQYPSLSRTTIYNTLKLFVANKVITPILIEENEMRYDADCEPHAHFKCLSCQSVYDLEVTPPIPTGEYSISESHLYYKGVCVNCQK